MMPQQPSVYQNMMNNQQQQNVNVYNSTPGNPTLNRTSSQTPMSISNQQWSNNPTMNVGRQSQNAYNQVKKFSFSFLFLIFSFFLKMMPPDPQQHYAQQQQQQQQQQHYQ
jgi:hypothetical protein